MLIPGLGLAAVLYLPALLAYANYTVAIFYRWWTIHLWVEGVGAMIQGGFLANLLIRLSGADRAVMEKWRHVIVSLVFIADILGMGYLDAQLKIQVRRSRTVTTLSQGSDPFASFPPPALVHSPRQPPRILPTS